MRHLAVSGGLLGEVLLLWWLGVRSLWGMLRCGERVVAIAVVTASVTSIAAGLLGLLAVVESEEHEHCGQFRMYVNAGLEQ